MRCRNCGHADSRHVMGNCLDCGCTHPAFHHDIRIVARITVQPVLFGSPVVSTAYQCVDWQTDAPLSPLLDTLPQAEQVCRDMLMPSLAGLAAAYAECTMEE